MRTQPRFFPAVTRLSLGVAALVAVLFAAGCASKGSGSSAPTAPNLSATVSALGAVNPGQTGKYTILVSNAAGALATSGTVTVTDPPTGFTITGASGTDWTCQVVSGTPPGLSCMSSDVIAPGASYPLITVTGTVTGAAGSTISIPITISGGGLTTSGSSQGSVSIVSPLTISKAFSPISIGQGASSTLTFTITNPAANTVSQTGVGFTDTLPSGLIVATPNGIGGTCSPAATATAGSTSISLSGATVAANASCTVIVNVTGSTIGNFTNTSGAVSSTNGGTGNTASASLGVVAFPTVSKAFGAPNVPLNGSTSLSFTITNPTANSVTLNNIAFGDTFPPGLAVASPNGLTNTCAGTPTATAGSGVVNLTGVTLAPSASCVLSVNVTGTIAGAKANVTGATSSTQSPTGGPTSNTATLTVIAPPTISDAFGAPSVPLNGTPTSLTFTLANPNASTGLTGVAFADTLPAGLVISNPNGLGGSCTGTVTAIQGTTAISLTGGTLAGGASCTVILNVTGIAAGAQANTSGAVSSTNGGTGVASNTATLSVLAPPTISKAFSPAGIPVNGTSALTFTLTNPAANTLALTGVGFTDTLPANTTVASPNGLVNSCGGTATAVAGSNSVSLSGVSLTTTTPTNTCTLVVNVTATQAGTFTNTTAAVTSTNGGTGLTATAILTTAAPPTITKSFLPTSIPLNGTSALSFTIMSPAANPAPLTNIAFTDPLPSGMLIATPNGLTGSCGGTITVTAGTNSVSLSGATLAPAASCTFTVNVTASAGGAKSNTTAAISSTQSGGGATSNTAILTVILPPMISDAFGAPSVPLNGAPMSLTFTLTNPNASNALTGVAFADTLPAGLVISSPNALTNTCNGTPTATAGSSAISLTGGTLAASGTCTVVLNVTGTAVGAKSNTSGVVSSTEGGTGTASNTASLAVLGPPTISKAFGASGVPVNGMTSLTFTLTNPPANTLALTGVGFTDLLPANTAVATPNGLVNNCGGTATAVAASGTVTLSGVTLATSGTCTLVVNVTATAAGTFNNTTGTVSSTNGGTGLTASASLNAAAPPTISDLFGATSIPVNTSTSLSFTVTNPSTNTVSLTNISFADTLPSGLLISTPNGLTGTCVGNGTITAVQATNSVSLVGATLAPNTPCTFSVNVTATAAGSLSNTTGAISSTQSGAGATSNTQTLAVVAPPTFTKAFGANGIGVNASTTLTFTLTNPAGNTVALTGVGFTDTFPAGMQLTATPSVSSNCGGTLTDAPNAGIVSLSGVALPTGSNCTLVVNVTATAPGAFTNTTAAVASTNGGNGLPASASLTAAAAPTISKAFGAASIALNTPTSLSFTVTNPAANPLSLTGIAFTDALPAGLVVTTPNGLTGSCGGGAIGATQGSSTVNLGNATLASSGSCTFSVNVTGTTAGTKNNTTGQISSTQSGAGLTASASMTVVAPPQISELFGAGSIPVSGSTTLTLMISNPNASSTLSGVAFTDNLPSNLVVSSPNGLSSNCGGTATAVAGSGSISLSGGTLAASGSCTLAVSVTGNAPGAQNNSSGAVTSVEGGTGIPASATLAVLGPPTISKAFGGSGVPVNGTTTLTFTLTNPAANTLGLTGVNFSDTFPAGLQLTGSPVFSNTCGVAPTATAGTAIVSLAGVTLGTAPSNTCTLVVNVTATVAGTFNNTTGAIGSANGGTGLPSNTATLTAAITPTFSKAFTLSSIPLNGLTTLSFTIGNPSSNTVSLSSLAFTDSLPSGLVVSTPNGLSGTCGGGTITAVQATTSVSLSGATLVPTASCTFSVHVTGTTAGVKNNTTGQISSAQSGAGATANASLTVVAPPTISKQFGGASLVLGSSTSLTFTITNPNASSTLSGVGFTDTMPSQLVVATPNGLSGTCGSGTITAVAGSSSVSLSGGTLATSGSCTFSVNVTTTGTTTSTQNNLTSAVTSTEGGSGNTASASINLTSPCTTNCTISGNVSGPWIQDFVITLTPQPSGSGVNSLATGTNGAYSISGLTFGTTYNVSGSLPGYTYSPSSITVNGNLAGQTITATPQIASNSVSGTVSYSGTPSSSVTTFINVYSSSCTGCSPIGGTSFLGTPSSSGTSYTVRGLRSDSSNYFVRAEIGTIDAVAPNASDPAGNSSAFSLSSSQTGINVIVNPQTPPAPSTPNPPTVFPGNGAAFIVYDNPTDSNNDEIPASYTISYSTNGFTTSTSTPAIPAGNSNSIYVLSGLTNATSYQFKVTETNTSGSTTSDASSGVTIGSVVANNTISGTITFTGTPSSSAPLYVGVYSQTLGVYFQRIAPGFSSPVSYSFSNVPNGNFQLFAVIDQNNNGYIDAGDITNFNTANGPPLVAVNGNISGKTIALGSISSAASATVSVGTFHNVYSFQSDQYGINIGAQMGTKLPVSMTLFSGPNVALPFDTTTSQNNSGGNPIFNSSVIPTAGDPYQFLVTFADGSTQVVSSSVTAVLNPPQSLAINSPVAGTGLDPVLNWTAPSSTPVNTPYTYSVNLSGTTDSVNWQYPHNDQSNGLLSSTTNVQFDVDGKASGLTSPPNLTAGNVYDWTVQLVDALGNRSSSTTTYTAPGGVGPASKLIFTQQPGNATAGSTMPTVQVTIEDASNNTVISATNTITLSISNNPGGGTLGGTFSVNAVAGVATFSSLSINNPGTGYTLQASGGSFTATSSAFNVAGAATQLVFTVQPVTNVAPTIAIAPAVQVSIEDAANRVVTTATNLITMAIGTNPASGTLTGTTSMSAIAGVATFSNLSINNSGNGYTLQASGAGFIVTSSTFNVLNLPTTQIVNPAAPPLQAGSGARTFTIKITNDQSGDLPSMTNLTLNGVACTTSTCGQFGTVTFVSLISGTGTYTVPYTPPASLTSAVSPTVTFSPSLTGSWFAGTNSFTVNPPGVIVTLNSSPVAAGVLPNSGSVNLIFTVFNDTVVGGVGEGVTIAPLTAFGYACQNLSPNSCGTLGTPAVSTNTGTSTTTITVPYTPPPTSPAVPYDRPLIFGTSVADPTKSIARSFQILGSSGFITSALTGGSAVPLGPIGFTDATDVKSASWTITAGDISCTVTPTSSPCVTASGTLTDPITTNANNVSATATYTPPASVPTGPGETSVSITMTETANSQVFTGPSFNIVDGSCGTGNNAVLNGSYAFLLKGGTAGSGYNTIIGSFTADGSGHISSGLEDINRSTGTQTGLSILSAGSSYSLGSDNRGCLTLANSGGGTQTFRIALGTISGGVASQGTMIRFDDTTGVGPRQTGVLKLQNLTSISSSSFNGTYAFGLDGMDNTGGRIAVAGLTTANGAGAITSVTEDVNDNGSVTNIPSGISGTYSLATNPPGGRGTFAVTFSGVTSNTVLYVISPSDAFIMSLDPTDANHPIVSGESKLRTTTAFPTAPANSTNYVLYVTGIDNSNGGSDTTLGQVQFGASSNGTATAVTLDDNDNGIESSEQVQSGASALTFTIASSGRMTVSGGGGGNNHPPVFYMVDMTQGFIVGTDGTVSSGYIQQQTGPLNNTSLPAQAFFGGGAPTAGGSYDVGAVSFNTTALTIAGTSDSSQPNFGGSLRPNSSISDNGAAIPYTFAANGTFTPTAPGQGTFAGALLAYIVSPTKIVFMQIGGTSQQNANSPELFIGQQ
jgi:uncharacterized repeat protein (TIGR01451 family)